MRVLLIFTLVLLASKSFAQVVDVSLFSAMDGSFHMFPTGTTNFWGYGYTEEGEITLPAPLLRFNKGDSVDIEFTNVSFEAHTIHLHGLDVNQVNDGVPSTSFFVFAGDTVNYRFRADYEGTYLYHCHVTTTLHLTMGMYGMIVVEVPGNQLYEGGPVYDSSYDFLFSDLEVETNDIPTLSFPFHEIKPDYFMVNGRSGGDLGVFNDLTIEAAPMDQIALRLGSMAYSKVQLIIPEELNAEVHMSDGRVFENAYESTELEIYPGERFSVMIHTGQEVNDHIEVQYYSMVNNEYEYSNFIPVRISSSSIKTSSLNEDILFPNPAGNFVRFDIEKCLQYRFYSSDGRQISDRRVCPHEQMDVSSWPTGLYLCRDEEGNTSRLIVR